ncbi:MAG TPA: hypothetical protein ENI87_03620 [bacterium]|nr:hypothetical protein [bacterium]
MQRQASAKGGHRPAHYPGSARVIQSWLEQAQVDPLGLPKGPLMEGVRYGRNQWSTLERFLSDGRIREISNNGCERALRAVVVGRKNCLFFGSGEGSETTIPALRVGELTPLGWRQSQEKRSRSAEAKTAIDSVVRGLFAAGGA